MISTPAHVDIRDAAYRLLRLPAIADKTFLITIGDRTVGGMISRDPMVGPWQTPVSDVAVTRERLHLERRRSDGDGRAHAARAARRACFRTHGCRGGDHEYCGRRHRRDLSDVRLSANWMAACGEPGEDADLYATVQAVGEEFCPALGITIPVGKDSLSMKTSWSEAGVRHARWSRRCR